MTPTVNLKATSPPLNPNPQRANQDRAIPLTCPYALCQHQHPPDLPQTRQSPLIHSSKLIFSLHTPNQPPTQPHHLSKMQRPRNRQPPPSNQRGSYPPSRSRGSGGGRGITTTPPHAPRPVPTTAQVHPGTAVSIILKADQPTGHQVHGIVGELLTRGDHPRGIKVRLRDGRVGRVQGLCAQAEALAAEEAVRGDRKSVV